MAPHHRHHYPLMSFAARLGTSRSLHNEINPRQDLGADPSDQDVIDWEIKVSRSLQLSRYEDQHKLSI